MVGTMKAVRMHMRGGREKLVYEVIHKDSVDRGWCCVAGSLYIVGWDRQVGHLLLINQICARERRASWVKYKV